MAEESLVRSVDFHTPEALTNEERQAYGLNVGTLLGGIRNQPANALKVLAAIQNLVAALSNRTAGDTLEKINAIVAALEAVAAVTQNTQDDQLVAVLRAKLADPNFVSLLQAIISVVTGWVGQQNPVSNPSPAAGTPDLGFPAT